MQKVTNSPKFLLLKNVMMIVDRMKIKSKLDSDNNVLQATKVIFP